VVHSRHGAVLHIRKLRGPFTLDDPHDSRTYASPLFADLNKEPQRKSIIWSPKERQEYVLLGIQLNARTRQPTVYEKRDVDGTPLEDIADIFGINDRTRLVILSRFMEDTIERITSSATLVLCLLF
jgi:hypothetical protein